MSSPLPYPLGGTPPPEIELEHSPLALVLVQSRFSTVLKIDSTDGVAAFQERIRGDYPLLDQTKAQALQIEVGSVAPSVRPVTTNVWRFSTADRAITASLTSESITLHASRYEGRAAFLERWAALLRHVEEVFAPGLALRAGARYLNRVQGESLARLTDWVRPNLVGVALPEMRSQVVQAISEANMHIDEGELLLRWGILPTGATIDPFLLPPVMEESWILDIDTYSEIQRGFSATSLSAEFRALAERAYSVFRWVVTEDGMTGLGAKG